MLYLYCILYIVYCIFTLHAIIDLIFNPRSQAASSS